MPTVRIWALEFPSYVLKRQITLKFYTFGWYTIVFCSIEYYSLQSDFFVRNVTSIEIYIKNAILDLKL